MAFKRPRAAVRTVIPAIYGSPSAKDFLADLYTYLSSSVVTAATVGASGGTGFAINDLVRVAGGTGTSTATLIVTGVSTGAVTTFDVNVGGAGAYTSNPTTTNNATTTYILTAIVGTSGGSSYVVGDTLTIAGGTGTSATVNVETVDGGGAVTSISIINDGAYTANPATLTNNAVTGGTGTGAQITITMSGGGASGGGAQANLTMDNHWTTSLANDVGGGPNDIAVLTATANNDGANYVIGDVLTVSGGTGTAATVTVTNVDGSGAVTEVALRSRGEYTVAPGLLPVGPFPTTSEGFTFQDGGGAVDSIILNDGSTWAGRGWPAGATAITVTNAENAANNFSANGTPNISFPNQLNVPTATVTAHVDDNTAIVNPPGVGTTGGSGSAATLSITTGLLTGSYSFKAVPTTAPTDLPETFELNFRNTGTQTAPSTGYWGGINPDGDTDPIADSKSPNASANFSGDGTGNWPYGALAAFIGVTVSDQYVIFDFDDALCVFFYDTGKTNMPRGFHIGHIFESRWEDEIDGTGGSTDIRIDGLSCLGYYPDPNPISSTAGAWWYYNPGTINRSIYRQALGNGVNYTSTSSWRSGVMCHFNNTASTYQFGASAEERVCPVPVYLQQGGNILYAKLTIGEYKYLRGATTAVPFTKKSSGSVDYLFHFGVSAVSATGITVHTPQQFVATTDGTYL